MGVQFTIKSQQCLNKFRNGDTYTDNTGDVMQTLSGNVDEEIKFITQVEVYKETRASQTNPISYDGFKITRKGGSFIADGFFPGPTLQQLTNNGNGDTFTFTIDSISNDGLVMEYTYSAGTHNPPVVDEEDLFVRVNNMQQATNALIAKFGIIENDSNFSTESLLTQEAQGYYLAAPNPPGFDPTPLTMVAQGKPNSWVSGNMTIELTALGDVFRPIYEIVQTFIINGYREGQLENLRNNISPPELIDDNSLKLVYDFVFGEQLNDPTTHISDPIQNRLGSAGDYNESQNGFDNIYEVKSVGYLEVATGNPSVGLITGSKTRVTTVIRKKDLSPMTLDNDRVGATFKYLAPEAEYVNTETDYRTNLMFDDLYTNAGDPDVIGTNEIKLLSATLAAGELTVVTEIEFTPDQQNRFTENSEYLIAYVVGDKTLNNGSSDRVTLKADLRTFVLTADIPDLMAFDTFRFFQHDKVIGLDSGASDYVGWPEDGIAISFDFRLDLNKSAFINSLLFDVIAYNSVEDTEFVLDTYTYQIGDLPTSGGIQQLNIDTLRGYNLAAGSQFNKVSIQVGPNVAGMQHYTGVFAQKIPWQENIPNPNVDQVFYVDNPATNNNLNFKASNYSNGKNGYQIKVAVRANVFGINTIGQSGNTDYRFLSPDLTIFDYGEDDQVSPVWDPIVLETFDNSNMQDLSGGVSTVNDTLLKVTYTNSSGPVASIVDFWAVPKIEESNQQGYDNFELSSILPSVVNNLLKPTVGESFTKISIDSGNVVVECLIDVTRVNPEAVYNLSSRLSGTQSNPLRAQFMNGDNADFMNGDIVEFFAT